jgi:hypothetical protein
MIVVTAVAVMLAGGLRAARLFRTEVGQGVSAEQANRLLWACKVPDSSKDVWFESSRKETQVECNIDEATFLKWSKELGAESFPAGNSPVRYCPIGMRDQSIVMPKHGYDILAYTPALNTRLVGAYDADKGRAYIYDTGRR